MACPCRTTQPQAFEHLTFHSVSTTDDPVIREQTKKRECNVYTTDAILACIAAAPRSFYSWDLVFHRVGDSVFIDKVRPRATNSTGSAVPRPTLSTRAAATVYRAGPCWVLHSLRLVVTLAFAMTAQREDSQFDFLTVNETSHEPPSSEDKDDVNSMQSLSQEATMINQNFSQQVGAGKALQGATSRGTG